MGAIHVEKSAFYVIKVQEAWVFYDRTYRSRLVCGKETDFKRRTGGSEDVNN